MRNQSVLNLIVGIVFFMLMLMVMVMFKVMLKVMMVGVIVLILFQTYILSNITFIFYVVNQELVRHF